jgi:hypothetical protein
MRMPQAIYMLIPPTSESTFAEGLTVRSSPILLPPPPPSPVLVAPARLAFRLRRDGISLVCLPSV